MSTWLNERQLARTAPAERALPKLPIPTQVVSNGEHVPQPQSADQQRVERALIRAAAHGGARLGLTRREFLRTSCGMAAAFLAMNSVYGSLFDVSSAEAADPDLAAARAQKLRSQFVFDVQNHFVRDDFDWDGILALGEYAKRWNPVLVKEGITMERYKFENYVKEVFLDSDTTIALLSAAPSDSSDNMILNNDQLARARAIVNAIAGSRRLLCHAVIRPGQPGWLDEIDRAITELKPDSWKGYTVGDPLAPSGYPWRLDDEKLMYPAYEKMRKAGIRNVCIHKGLLPADYETTWKNWRYAMVDDVPRAAKDWPDLNFIIYHSALKPFLTSPDESLAQFETTGRMDWVTDLAEIPAKHGVTNVYGELGTTFASSVITHPRHCAAMLGTLVRGLGADKVLWGTDAVWYGSPQWQIEAFRRIEIPADMQKQHSFAPLGEADGPVKRGILGRNAAPLYGIDVNTQLASEFSSDRFSQLRRDYLAAGAAPSLAAYGYVAARS
ncbi:MAG: amidohydrolase family protein [Candidatus Binatia bacterium]